ncbi:MAG: GGDEF domain-containing protein [Pseudomonadota bacterium]
MSETIMGLLNPMIVAIFAAIFLALWKRDPDDKSVLAFSLGHFLMASGFLVFHLTPNPDAAAWALFMHLIYCSATGFVCWGAAARVGQKFAVPWIVVIGLLSGALMFAGSFGPDMNARLMAANTGYGLMFALSAQVIGRAEKRTILDKTIFWLMVITAIQFFVRPQIAIILGGPMSAEAYRASDYYAVLMLFMGVDSLVLALAFVAAVVSDQWRTASEEAEIDPLSGLKMRRSFESAAMDMLEDNIDRDLSICMIVVDIDHFKRVNDIWGHQAGDQAIATFGRLIDDTVRATDLCGRIGGEEFCVLVYNCEHQAAEGLANRIRRRFVDQEIEGLGPDIRLTASFGVTEWRQGEGFGKLFARADAALYKAKALGRDCVVNADRMADARSGSDPSHTKGAPLLQSGDLEGSEQSAA